MTGEEVFSEPYESLRNAYEVLNKKDTTGSPVQTLYLNGRTIVGVDSSLEDTSGLGELRRLFVATFGCEDMRILQVVGDSGCPFNWAAIPRALKVLSDQAAGGVIEYGYTAVDHDTNWLVAEIIAKSPEVGPRTIANVVGQSIECLQQPSWSGSPIVTNFVMLHSRDSYTKFGQDTWLSDGIMLSSYGDKMLCFEGGLQAFRQCTNALVRNIEVVAMTDLRCSNTRVKFSAACLLHQLKKTHADSDAQAQASEYLNQLSYRTGSQAEIVHSQVERIITSKLDWRACIVET